MASAFIDELKNVATEANKKPYRGYSGQFMGSPSGGRGPSRERDRNSTGRSGSRRRGGWRGGGERLKIVATEAKKKPNRGYSGQFMGSPSGGRGPSREG